MDGAMTQQAGAAIEALERALDLAELTHADVRRAVDPIIEMRNAAVAGHREGRVGQAALDRANALLSLAYGCLYPLAGIHRGRLAQCRDELRALLGEQGAG